MQNTSQGGRVVNTPDLRLLSVKGDTKSETQNILVRKTSGLQGIPAGSNPALGIIMHMFENGNRLDWKSHFEFKENRNPENANLSEN